MFLFIEKKKLRITCSSRNNSNYFSIQRATEESMLKILRRSYLLHPKNDSGNCFSVLSDKSLECMY